MSKKVASIILAFLMLTGFTFAQGKWGLQVNGGVFLPGGDMGDTYKTGFGGTAGLTYDISNSFQLGISSGYMTWSFDESVFTDAFPGYDISVDAPLTIIPLMVGAKYFFTSGSFRPYANLNLGLHFVNVKAGDVTVNGMTQNIGESHSGSETGWGIGVGFLVKAGKNMNVDINAGFNGTSTEFGKSSSGYQDGAYVEESTNSTGTWISLMAGLHFAL